MLGTSVQSTRWSGMERTRRPYPAMVAMMEPEPRGWRAEWWGKHVTDLDPELRREIFKEIEVAKEVARKASTAITIHERECAIRYSQIQSSHENHAASLKSVESTLAAIALKIGVQDVTTDNKVATMKTWALTALVVFLIGALSWAAGRIYDLEPARVAAAETGK